GGDAIVRSSAPSACRGHLNCVYLASLGGSLCAVRPRYDSKGRRTCWHNGCRKGNPRTPDLHDGWPQARRSLSAEAPLCAFERAHLAHRVAIGRKPCSRCLDRTKAK